MQAGLVDPAWLAALAGGVAALAGAVALVLTRRRRTRPVNEPAPLNVASTPVRTLSPAAEDLIDRAIAGLGTRVAPAGPVDAPASRGMDLAADLRRTLAQAFLLDIEDAALLAQLLSEARVHEAHARALRAAQVVNLPAAWLLAGLIAELVEPAAAFACYAQAGDPLGDRRAGYVAWRLDRLADAERRLLAAASADSGAGCAAITFDLAQLRAARGAFTAAAARFEAAEALDRAAGRTVDALECMSAQAEVALRLGQNDRARQLFEGVEREAAAVGAPALEARASLGLGGLALGRDDVTAAEAAFRRAFVVAEALVRGDLEAEALDGLAHIALRRGEAEAAEAFLARALALDDARGTRLGAALRLAGLGETALARGEPALADARLRRSLALAAAAGRAAVIVRALTGLAQAASLRGDEETAARLRGQAASLEAAPSPP